MHIDTELWYMDKPFNYTMPNADVMVERMSPFASNLDLKSRLPWSGCRWCRRCKESRGCWCEKWQHFVGKNPFAGAFGNKRQKCFFFFFADYFPMRSMHEIFAYMYLLSRTSNSWQWDFPYESSFGWETIEVEISFVCLLWVWFFWYLNKWLKNHDWYII